MAYRASRQISLSVPLRLPQMGAVSCVNGSAVYKQERFDGSVLEFADLQ
jgi:hypothetical protein